MQYNEIDIRDFLIKYSGKKVTYCANPGNAGDAIIAHATYSLFDELVIDPDIIRPTDQVRNEVIFYSGGGALVEGKYHYAFRFLENNYLLNKAIIILPHTVFGFEKHLCKMTNLTIICREKMSYEHLLQTGFPENRLFLAHDLAFRLSPQQFSAFQKKGEGTAFCYRKDGESLNSSNLPGENIDISLSWNGEFWHRPDFTKIITESLASYLSDFEVIRTDRLHIGILAALLGKQVFLYPNDYYKIKAVYDYSIRDHFQNVTFMDGGFSSGQPDFPTRHDVQNETIDMHAEIQQLQNTLNQLYQSRSWKMTAPFREIARMLHVNRKPK